MIKCNFFNVLIHFPGAPVLGASVAFSSSSQQTLNIYMSLKSQSQYCLLFETFTENLKKNDTATK